MTLRHLQRPLTILMTSFWLAGGVHGLTLDFGGPDDMFESACQVDQAVFVTGRGNQSYLIASYGPDGASNPAFSQQDGHLTLFPEKTGRGVDIQVGPDGLLWTLGEVGEPPDTVVTHLHLNGTIVQQWRSHNHPLPSPKQLLLPDDGSTAYVLFEKRADRVSDTGPAAFSVNALEDGEFDAGFTDNQEFEWRHTASYFDGSQLFTVAYLQQRGQAIEEDQVIGYRLTRHDLSGNQQRLNRLTNRIRAITGKGDTLFLAGDEFVGRLNKQNGTDLKHIATDTHFEAMSDSLLAIGLYNNSFVLGDLRSLQSESPSTIQLVHSQPGQMNITISGLIPHKDGLLLHGSASGNALLIRLDNQQRIDTNFGNEQSGATCIAFFGNCGIQETTQIDNRSCQGTIDFRSCQGNHGGCDLSGGSTFDSTQDQTQTTKTDLEASLFGGISGGVITSFVAGTVIGIALPFICKAAKAKIVKKMAASAICGPCAACCVK